MRRTQRQPLLWVCIAVLFVLALLAAARTVPLTLENTGSYDLHAYWYFGHFVRQGQNPYQAFVERPLLALPIHYLDGRTVTAEPVMQPNLGVHVPNTAPMMLLLSGLSWFSWPVAKAIWLVCNVVFTAAVPWLILALLPASLRLPRTGQWLVAGLFYLLKAPRLVTVVGQTSLCVLFLMLAAVLVRKRSWLLSGLLLGVAVSKYSLALPAALWLLIDRRYLVLGTALAVQVAGLLLISSLGTYSPLETVAVYIKLMVEHVGEEGIHIAYFTAQYRMLGNLLVAGGSLILLWRLCRWWWRARPVEDADVLPVMTVLSLWTLLVAYHRSYDVILVGLFLVLGSAMVWHARLPVRQVRAVVAFMAVAMVVLCLPMGTLRGIVPSRVCDEWLLPVERASTTLTLLAMLGVSTWFLEAGSYREAGDSMKPVDTGETRHGLLSASAFGRTPREADNVSS